jgi:hypothetical protein
VHDGVAALDRGFDARAIEDVALPLLDAVGEIRAARANERDAPVPALEKLSCDVATEETRSTCEEDAAQDVPFVAARPRASK